jgi:putative RecB family exonuclease
MEVTPAEPTAPDSGVLMRTTLSPSRAGDFVTCPLLYRFRVIDRLPEAPDPMSTRGSLLHAVLEDLFAEPAAERTVERARELLPHEWERMREEHPSLAELFRSDDGVEQAAEESAWLASAVALLDSYFALEDPRRVEPEARELRLEHTLESGLTLGGIADRVDVAPDGRIRVVDYKSGRSPHERYEAKALFQMRFYALVIWRTRGVIPTVLQLLYLSDRTVLEYTPTEHELLATERKVVALWEAITDSLERREFEPSPGAMCRWCSHRAVCPEWGGTPPPMPEVTLVPADHQLDHDPAPVVT